jgi:hypothetical protein
MALNVLLIRTTDLKKRKLTDWIIAHVSGSLPPHRLRGKLDFTQQSLLFDGIDTYTNTPVTFEIPRESIQQVYHGYDKIFNVFQTRGLGLNWAPVRLQLSTDEPDNFLYLIAGYTTMGTQNKELFQFLTDWLS